jgi:bacillolysin
MKKIILGILTFSVFACSTEENTKTPPEQVKEEVKEEIKQDPVVSVPPKYCESAGIITSEERLDKVVFGSINNASTGKGGYEDFTNISGNFALGSSNTISLTPGLYSQYGKDGFGVQFFVYIDYNQDGDFTDPGETVWKSKQGTDPVNRTITIPSTASLGSTRMRIEMRSILSLPGTPVTDPPFGTGCGTFQYGQVEDYTVNIKTKL